MILSDKHSNGPQFSKIMVIITMLLAIAGIAMAVSFEMPESVAIAIIGICGTMATTSMIWNLKKSQAENTMRIYMSTYKEILKLKQEYGNTEECSELIGSMEQNMQGKIDTNINESIDDANSMIELNVPNIL
jgi:hypothetical protein